MVRGDDDGRSGDFYFDPDDMPYCTWERKGLKFKKILEAKPKVVGEVTRGESESGPGPTRARVPWGKPS